MSELINTRDNRATIRWKLLTSVSAAALLVSAYTANDANAADSDRPIVWIEGGWQFEQANGLGAPFDPSFVPSFLAAGLPSPLTPQSRLGYGYGAEGAISFQPENSDWIFSASVRYGRSHGHQRVHEELPGPTGKGLISFYGYTKHITNTALNRYDEASASNGETHLIADFQVGKDVGLGMFGSGSTSTLGFGVRYAQLHSQRSAKINGRPDTNFGYVTTLIKYHAPVSQYHAYVASAQRMNSFQGIGPSISWNNSTPLAGNTSDGEIALDWGMNASVLFGRQRAKVQSQYYTINVYAGPKYQKTNGKEQYTHIAIARSAPHHTRSRSVVVPNLGGFAGVSWRYADAKISFGYRADMFFGAIDGGIDARKSENRGFYGPFASFSVGVGD